MDLVEVSPNTDPPVCKIMDYGKTVYQTQKKQKKSSSNQTKELRFKPRIGDHDLDVKIGHAKKFLKQGFRVQFTVMLRGRELAHKDLGEELMGKVKARIEGDGKVEQEASWDRRSLKMMVVPNKGKP